MSALEDAGFPAFPSRHSHEHFQYAETAYLGMTLRDYFAAKALTNPALCTGVAAGYELTQWFGSHTSGITRAQIVARQASEYADAMLAARSAC